MFFFKILFTKTGELKQVVHLHNNSQMAVCRKEASWTILTLLCLMFSIIKYLMWVWGVRCINNFRFTEQVNTPEHFVLIPACKLHLKISTSTTTTSTSTRFTRLQRTTQSKANYSFAAQAKVGSCKNLLFWTQSHQLPTHLIQKNK